MAGWLWLCLWGCRNDSAGLHPLRLRVTCRGISLWRGVLRTDPGPPYMLFSFGSTCIGTGVWGTCRMRFFVVVASGLQSPRNVDETHKYAQMQMRKFFTESCTEPRVERNYPHYQKRLFCSSSERSGRQGYVLEYKSSDVRRYSITSALC